MVARWVAVWKVCLALQGLQGVKANPQEAKVFGTTRPIHADGSRLLAHGPGPLVGGMAACRRPWWCCGIREEVLVVKVARAMCC